MRIPALVQTTVFDVADWAPDADFPVFPQGARAKEAFNAPERPPEAAIVPNKRYLFKRSKRSYPDQFWGEVIAYRIGCLMGVQVPPAFVAQNSSTGITGALIEWFYSGNELFVHAGDFLQVVRPDYDRDRGIKHNLEDIRKLLQAMISQTANDINWRHWWIDALTFDALIGNTDRHQDNWGFIFGAIQDQKVKVRLSPLFDNGTSLGHERFPSKVASWDEARLRAFIDKGTHHVKWKFEIDKLPLNGHMTLLAHAIENWQGTVDLVRSRLDFDEDEMVNTIEDLAGLNSPVPLSAERLNFIVRLLRSRYKLLKELTNDPTEPPR
jgi:hypothetical protein